MWKVALNGEEPALNLGDADMILKEMAEQFKDDPEYQAEGHLLALTEKICEIHGQYRGIYLVLFWVLEWTADKLIYRKRKE